ncbi:hypothetical protein AURDEDRAFT_174841 [Auricularia subglabra TFB-10046 SS5]|nr:hypothetical protein AURDEDRAFT_174841 [Auricularia subglabra TFB-10046 SS5]
MTRWHELPDELIQRVAQVAAAYLYGRDGRWVGKSLALVNRTFCACVRPVVLGELVLRRSAGSAFHTWLGAVQREHLLRYTNALVVRVYSDRPHFDWAVDDRLASTFCRITFVAIPFHMFSVLARHEEFRPTTLFLDNTFLDKPLNGRDFQRAFSLVTHLYSVTSTPQFPHQLPSLTHAVLGLCCSRTLPQLLDTARCSALRRLLACMPSGYDMSPKLRNFHDDRIWVLQREPWDTAAAIDALNGEDVWDDGEPLSTFRPPKVAYRSPLALL